MITYLRENITGEPSKFLTQFSIDIMDDNIIATFIAKNSQKFSAYCNYNEPIYIGDVVELFLQLDCGNKYFEIEVAPNGTKFFALITNVNDSVICHEFLPDTIIANVEDYEDGYKTTMIIPFSSIGYSAGHDLRYNAFRIETEGGFTNKNLLALSPTYKPTFHDYKVFKVLSSF